MLRASRQLFKRGNGRLTSNFSQNMGVIKRRNYCSNQSISNSAKCRITQCSEWLMERKTGRLLIKGAGLHCGLLIGAALVVPEPMLVINGMYRFLTCFSVSALIAMDYKWSLRNIPEDKYDEVIHVVHERSARRLLSLFQYTKGIFIKFGQHLSALDYLLPEEYTSTMKVLQHHAPHVEYEDIEQVFLDEFGKTPDELYDNFNKEPLAAASLAQVHEGYIDGQKVAIKVQFPGLRETCAGDSLTIQVLLGIMTKMFPEFGFSWLIKEVNLNLPKELNFRQEALNASLVKNNFKGEINVVVPSIIWDYTTSRILVMEFCEGTHINDIEAMKKQNINTKDVAIEITNIFDKMAFEDGFIHCDPHPGNLLIRTRKSLPEDGKIRRFLRWSGFDKSKPFEIVLLDHGLYRNLDEDNFKKDYLQLWNALINFNEEEIDRISTKFNAAAGYRIFCSILTAKPWDKISNPGELDSSVDQGELERVAASARKFLKEIMQTLQTVKPELLLLFKTNDLLRSIHRDLDSGVNTFVVTSKNVNRLLCKQSLENDPSWLNYIKVSCRRASFASKLYIYEWYMYFKS